tara:strand:- start:10189 stop:10554 length:366 start_codon:yes stop_codon:yes gene_type:complete
MRGNGIAYTSIIHCDNVNPWYDVFVPLDLDQPLPVATVKQLVRSILDNGQLIFSKHALAELAKDSLTTTDAVAVLRGGAYTGPEFENGGLRYRSEGRGVAIIFELEEVSCCVVITGWKMLR